MGPNVLPVRYPGTEKSGDGSAMLARKTDWQDVGGIGLGCGQRILATDALEIPLLEVRTIVLNTTVTAGQVVGTDAAKGTEG
jgi:type VI secretion system protein ImpE